MGAAAWPLVVVPVTVLVTLVLLAITCLRCRGRGPKRSIQQALTAEESSDFRVISQSEHTLDPGSAHRTSNHLQSPSSPPVEAGIQPRSRPFTPDTDSNASYVNPGNGSGYVNDEFDRESDGYIIVVPGDESNHSGLSTPSLHSYENVPGKREDREYQNVDPQGGSDSTSDQSAQSDSDDGDMGNYVNVRDEPMSN